MILAFNQMRSFSLYFASQAPGHGFLEEMSWAELKERLKVLQAQHERTEMTAWTRFRFGIEAWYDMSCQESG